MAVTLFKKRLTATDVNNKFSVPSRFLRNLNGNGGGEEGGGVEVEVMDEVTGMTYELILQTRAGKYRKPVFQSKGWQKLVKDKGLVVGETIYLYKDSSRMPAEEARRAVFKIRASLDLSLSTTCN